MELMPKVDKETPEVLRPFLFHRLDLSWGESKEANGDCPFCTKEKRFYVNLESGQWNCRVCGVAGNTTTFLRKLYEASRESMNEADYKELAEERKVSVTSLVKWGLVQSVIDVEWMLPTYTAKNGKEPAVSNLYRYSVVNGKRRLIGTSGFGHSLFNLQHWDATKPTVHIVEGPWDGMAWEEALRSKLSRKEILKTANIVAVPGCETFKDEWVNLFAAKEVIIFFDNDHPKTNPKGKLLEPAGFKGCKMVARKLKGTAKTIKVLQWGIDGYDPSLPSGYDIRDTLNTNGSNTILNG